MIKMSEKQDIRSIQRFTHFLKALELYEQAAILKMNRLEEEGLIHRFEYTFELAWKCLQDLLQERGYVNIRGPLPVIEQAFQDGIISQGPLWLAMLKTRNELTHLYDEASFLAASMNIKGPFLKLFLEFKANFLND